MNVPALTIEPQRFDLLTVTLFVAAAFHAVFILGVSFSPFLAATRSPPALEVVLVQPNENTKAPEEAAYLAQTSQEGGGDTDENTRPTSPFSGPVENADGIAQSPLLATAPEQNESTADEVITAVFSDTEIDTDETNEDTSESQAPEGAVLVEQNLEIARLTAEIDKSQERRAKRPKKDWAYASTTKTTSADYMFKWVERVERIGNLNYPDDARRAGLTGSLILIVGIYKTGQIESVKIEKSSGHAVLDNAAIRIVRDAAPFDPMSGQLARETDILYIVRTWEFQSGNSVISY